RGRGRGGGPRRGGTGGARARCVGRRGAGGPAGPTAPWRPGAALRAGRRACARGARSGVRRDHGRAGRIPAARRAPRVRLPAQRHDRPGRVGDRPAPRRRHRGGGSGSAAAHRRRTLGTSGGWRRRRDPRSTGSRRAVVRRRRVGVAAADARVLGCLPARHLTRRHARPDVRGSSRVETTRPVPSVVHSCRESVPMSDVAHPRSPFADVPTRDIVRDAIAAVALLVALPLPWDVALRGSDLLWVVLTTVVALLAVAAPYARRAGLVPESWSGVAAPRARLVGLAPYALVALLYVVLDL